MFYFFTTSLLSFLQKRRQAEAINGALAVIGLTAALVLEGRTGNVILGQVHKLSIKRKFILISRQ